MDQRRLAGPQVPEFEEAVVGRPEGNGDAGRIVGRDAVGILQAKALGRGPALGVGAVDPTVTARSPTAKPRDLRAHLGDGARALVAHECGARRSPHPGG